MKSRHQQMKRNRFERIAAKRVERVVQALDSLGNCANRNNYEYSPEDVEKMMRTIRRKVRAIHTLYKESLGKQTKPFKF